MVYEKLTLLPVVLQYYFGIDLLVCCPGISSPGAHRITVVSPYLVRDLNFLDWYERWLDQALGGEPSDWFGYDNPDFLE